MSLTPFWFFIALVAIIANFILMIPVVREFMGEYNKCVLYTTFLFVMALIGHFRKFCKEYMV